MKITDADCRSCGACCVATGDGGDVLAYGYLNSRSNRLAIGTKEADSGRA
jgi:hypothetical protein